MSPISSIPTAFSLPTTAPSIPVDPGSAAQSVSMMPQYLVGTGGIFFATVAIVSVAGYFHHGRKKTNNNQRNSTWATFSNILASLRHRGSGTATAMAGSDWPADVEEGSPEHVSTVYTRFFHPTHWNLVESHPATPSAPAIYVEDEAKEIPPSEPKSDSDDGDSDGGKNDGASDAWENVVQGTERQVKEVPPYDTGSAMNVSFKSEVIGTTDRPGGAFLSVPGQYQDDSSETSSSDDASQMLLGCEIGLSSSPYDGIVTEPEIDVTYLRWDRILTIPPRTPDDAFETLPDSRMNFDSSPYDRRLADTESPCYRNQTDAQELICPSYDGVTTTSPPSPGQTYETTPYSETVPCYSPYGGITVDSQPDISCEPTQTTRSRSFPSARRYGIADMSDFARTLEDTIQEGGRGLVRTINCRSGLCDLADFGDTCSEMQSATSYEHLVRLKPEDKSRSVQGGRDDFRKRWADPDTFRPLYEGLDQLQKIIDEHDDSDAEDGDLDDDDFRRVSRLTLTVMDAQGGQGLVRTTGRQRGSCAFVDFGETDLEMDPATSDSRVVRLKPMDQKPRNSSNGVGVHDSGHEFRKNWADSDTFRPLYEGLDLLQNIIDEFDDSDAEDGDFENGEDSDVNERSISGLIPTWGVNSPGQVSLEWSSSDGASVHPVTPPQRSTMRPPCVHQACAEPPVTPRFNEEVQVFVPTCSGQPPWLPCEAYVRTRGPRRPLLIVHDSPPPMSATVHVVAPGVYMASPFTIEEIQATRSGLPPGLQSKAYVRTHRRSRPLLTVCDSPPQMSAALQAVAPSGYNALMESQVTPWFTEEVQATLSDSPPSWLQSKAYVRPHWPRHPQSMVCGPYLLPCFASEAA